MVKHLGGLWFIVLLPLQTIAGIAEYGIGYQIGENLGKQFERVDSKQLIRGFSDGILRKPLAIDETKLNEAIQAFQQKQQKIQQERQKMLASDNLEKGNAFLAKNKEAEGVVTLASGLQYKVIAAGDGATPKATDTVITHYQGTLIDGTEFDSSYKRNQPSDFPVNGVIPGWTEALQQMKVGAKWQLFIPAHLAYGERGAGFAIPPNSTLIFDIELLEIKS